MCEGGMCEGGMCEGGDDKRRCWLILTTHLTEEEEFV